MNFKEAQVKAEMLHDKAKQWLCEEIVRRLDQIQKTGEVEGYSAVMNAGRIEIKMPAHYVHHEAYKNPINDKRITHVNIGLYTAIIYHGDPDRWPGGS